MKKIPTLFVRDFTEPSKGRYVTEEVTPGCEWVLAGEGVPTRKYDGTCVMFDGKWWARREVKMGAPQPYGYVPVDEDPVTGKLMGWEPVEQSGFAKFFTEAHDNYLTEADGVEPPYGTYELCGPKIQRNPEGYEKHVLISHEFADRLSFVEEVVPNFTWATQCMPNCPFEGIVWHHPDGRMAKLKVRDFPKE